MVYAAYLIHCMGHMHMMPIICILFTYICNISNISNISNIRNIGNIGNKTRLCQFQVCSYILYPYLTYMYIAQPLLLLAACCFITENQPIFAVTSYIVVIGIHFTGQDLPSQPASNVYYYRVIN